MNVVKGEKGDKGDKGEAGKDGVDGKSVFDGYATNCITYIPQDIKLELNNGTLTLKAGSKVYVPNGKNADGSNKFDEVIIESDLTSVLQAEGVLMVNVSVNALGVANAHYSGASQPTLTGSGEGAVWYNTAENKMYRYNGSNWESNTLRALPVGKVTATSLGQVFNGFGYIGSIVYALPGVKGLIPNGRNADGSLKNIEFTIRNVSIMDTSSVDGGSHALYLHKNTGLAVGSYWGYDKEINGFKHESSYSYGILCEAGEIQLSNGRVTSLTPKQAFHAVDYSDSSTVSGWSMPSGKYQNLTLGATGAKYTATANGWFVLSKKSTAKNQLASMITSAGVRTIFISNDSSQDAYLYVPAQKNTTLQVFYNLGGATEMFRFYYCEGEN